MTRGVYPLAGIGFGGALTICLVVLKLTDTVSWSWVWILAPLWIPAAIQLIIVALIVWLMFRQREDPWDRMKLGR